MKTQDFFTLSNALVQDKEVNFTSTGVRYIGRKETDYYVISSETAGTVFGLFPKALFITEVIEKMADGDIVIKGGEFPVKINNNLGPL